MDNKTITKLEELQFEVELSNGETEELNIFDLARFFVTSRGFPTILNIGNISGEGQSGGRAVSEVAKEVEIFLIRELGRDQYISYMDQIIEKQYY